MRVLILTFAAGLTLGVTAEPAQAAWQNYVSHELGVSFEAPGTMTSEFGFTPRGRYVGTKEEMVFKSTENNIEFMLEVVNFAQAAEVSPTILGEAVDSFQGTRHVLMDTFGRVGSGKDAVYGRKTIVELPDGGGQATTAYYFTNGYLYHLTATVLPANGNYASPDVGRFIDSISFDMAGANPGAAELELPEY